MKGISYDVGAYIGMNWRPWFDPKEVHRELQIIKEDLQCNAVSIGALDVGRIVTAAADALDQGLEVWAALMWYKPQDETIAYLVKAARSLEVLREKWPDKLVMSVDGAFHSSLVSQINPYSEDPK